MNKKRVLIVSYFFPPRPSMASLRIRGLAKYLPEYGWSPVILTAKLPAPPDARYQVVQTDYPGSATSCFKRKFHLSPNQGLQAQMGVSRADLELKGDGTLLTRLFNTAKEFIAYPDEEKEWYSFAVRKGIDILHNQSFEAIISSSGPNTCHLIAAKLKAVSCLPWLADFRDLWTQNPYFTHSSLRLFFEKKLELKTLRGADSLVTVSGPLADQMKSLHHKNHVSVITNGFDADDVAVAPLTREFTITYTGQLYQGKRDPDLLFHAIKELIVEGRIDAARIRVRFWGSIPFWLEQEVSRHGLTDVVSLQSELSREEALNKQRESHVLLLLNWDNDVEKGVYTGKVFEYLAAQRPILALGGPGGVVADLLKETGAGIHVRALADLKMLLIMWYQAFECQGSAPYHADWVAVQKYSHREMARKFAQLLDELMTDRGKSAGRL